MIIETHPNGSRRLICCCARKSATRALVRKGLGRGSRSRRDSGGREADAHSAHQTSTFNAAVAAIPGGVRRLLTPDGMAPGKSRSRRDSGGREAGQSLR